MWRCVRHLHLRVHERLLGLKEVTWNILRWSFTNFFGRQAESQKIQRFFEYPSSGLTSLGSLTGQLYGGQM